MGLLVFGSVNLDLAVEVPGVPAPGQTVLGQGGQASPGGKGANQAHAARRFGATVHLAACVGDDGLATPALAMLASAGVDLAAVARHPHLPTGIATVMRLPGGDNAIVVSPGANAALQSGQVSETLVSATRWLLLQMETPAAESMALARRVKAAGGRVMLNLAPAQALDAIEPALLDALVLNRDELGTLCRALSLHDDDPGAAAAAVAQRWRCTTIVTLGAHGAVLCPADRPLSHMPAPPTNVVDTTGAGDTFCGVLAAAIDGGSDWPDAVRTACVAASLACRRPGAQAAQPTRHDIDEATAHG
jgi:ribokinase